MTEALVQFVRDRLDEDYEAARLTLGINVMARVRRGESAPRWVASPEGDAGIWDTDGTPRVKFAWARERDHIVRHDPVRVLREIAAKRLMLDEALASRHHISSDQYETCPRATEADGLDATQLAALTRLNEEQRHESGREPTCWDSCGRDARVHRTLELLALPYVDHPNYMQAVLAGQA
ncbi:DUF6221 family protein [Streptomyces sp. NPDC048211]|uniref:DUF6221 family protein n=1 Tax=Streptomyces sp. NPDC048211 TaxID=3365516 RepID=UPI00371952E5